MIQSILYFGTTLLLRAVLALVSVFPLATRVRIMRVLIRLAVRVLPPVARRADENLKLVYPQMSRPARRALVGRVAQNVGATLTEILFNADYAAGSASLPITGPGVAILEQAHADGTGAILVSGHFGQWEAVRHALRGRGMEVGALYRPNNNPYYEPIFRQAIEVAGTPIIPKSAAGNRQLLRHLKQGGILALLMDQYVQDGEALDFMGHAACTSLSAAELALRYDLPLIPVFGTRRGHSVEVELETPIPPGTPHAMMQAFNLRLAARVQADPDQWYWFHRRWRPHKHAVIWPPEGWTPVSEGA
ncbi:MAG: lysophospholipid acyltransferase family protein [Pseudomonadota bacterium]